MSSDPANRLRFGPFELDLQTRELWRSGVEVKLVGQPFEILVALLTRPGKLVTRDELKSRLWAEDTFVDFDHVDAIRDRTNQNDQRARRKVQPIAAFAGYQRDSR